MNDLIRQYKQAEKNTVENILIVADMWLQDKGSFSANPEKAKEQMVKYVIELAERTEGVNPKLIEEVKEGLKL